MEIKNDLSNQTYNNLYVIGFDKEESKGKRVPRWRCRCLLCGKERCFTENDLIKPVYKDCGAHRKEKMQKALRKNISGQIFGSLKALSINEEKTKEENQKRARGDTWWNVECQKCGRITCFPLDWLIRGACTSCGHCGDIEINRIYGGIKVLNHNIERSKVEKRNFYNVECLNCGRVFTTRQDRILSHLSSCGCLLSKGQILIAELLKENNISYVEEKWFNSLKSTAGGALRFDFYLPEENVCIEFDGEQHYKMVNYFGGEKEFLKRQENDKIKNEWCKENHIPLIRIPYTKLNSLAIEDLLLNSSKFII